MTTPAQPRAARCRVLDRHRDPCANEEIAEGFCMKHLRLAAETWAALVKEATDTFPRLAQALAEDDSP